MFYCDGCAKKLDYPKTIFKSIGPCEECKETKECNEMPMSRILEMKKEEEQNLVKTSKFLSLILRHKPEKIALKLDRNGWAIVDEILEKTNISFQLLEKIVETNNKKRFAFSDDLSKIRASQGHSIDIDLQLEPIKPPDILYHGTVQKFMESISEQGLTKQKRQHVHLSHNIETAHKVGKRRGTPIILQVDAKLMYVNGYKFYLSQNGVWLTDHVPNKFIMEKEKKKNAT